MEQTCTLVFIKIPTVKDSRQPLPSTRVASIEPTIFPKQAKKITNMHIPQALYRELLISQ